MYCTVPFWIKATSFSFRKTCQVYNIQVYLTNLLYTPLSCVDMMPSTWRKHTEDETMPTPTEDYPWPSRDVGSLIEIPLMMRNVCWNQRVLSVWNNKKVVEVGSCSPPCQKWQLKLDFRTKPETLRVFLLLKMYLVTNSLILKCRNLKLLRFLMCDFGVATSQTPGWKCWVGDFTLWAVCSMNKPFVDVAWMSHVGKCTKIKHGFVMT